MSEFEKRATTHSQPNDASEAFRLELSITPEQVKKAEYAGAVLGASVLGIVALRTGKPMLMEKILPEIEEVIVNAKGELMRFTGAPPKLNYYRLNNGVELTLSKGARVDGNFADLISVENRLGETHMMADGSRRVIRYGMETFHDDTGHGIRVSFPSDTLRDVPFMNERDLTNFSRKTYRKLENCFLTGNMHPANRIPNLYERVSELYKTKF